MTLLAAGADSAPIYLSDSVVEATGTSAGCQTGVHQGRRIRSVLRRSPYRGLDGVGVVVRGTDVILWGRVSSYYLKQMAQESVRPLADGMNIRNRLRVERRAK